MKNYKLLFAFSLLTATLACLVGCGEDETEKTGKIDNSLCYVPDFDFPEIEEIANVESNSRGIVYKLNESGDSDDGYYELEYTDYSNYKFVGKNGEENMALIGLLSYNARASIAKADYDKLGIPLNTPLVVSVKLTNLGRYCRYLDGRTDEEINQEKPLVIPFFSTIAVEDWPQMPIQRKAYLVSARIEE